jgi:hypothetical protein
MSTPFVVYAFRAETHRRPTLLARADEVIE